MADRRVLLPRAKRSPALPLLLTAIGLLGGCGSAPPAPDYAQEGDFMARVQTQTQGGVTVRAGVPSADESQDLFAMDLYRRGVQPVWLEIHNGTDDDLAFLPVGLDPTYFTPAEASTLGQSVDSEEAIREIKEKQLYRIGMGIYIPPGETRNGFVFSSLDEGTKSFNIDVLQPGNFQSFPFFIPVPGLRLDHYSIDFEALYDPDEVLDLDRDELMAWLEEQVCCTTDKTGEGGGDPVNLVVIGDRLDIYVALMRAGWDETETVTGGTAWKTAQSFLFGGKYRYSPVSPLFVLGRPQDAAFQKARESINERNHLRLWLTPVRYEGKNVWLGQISRDIGVRWTKKTITTHKIDPDVDETREYLVEDLAYAQGLEKFAYVGGVGEATIDNPGANFTGDPWFTDGFRVVLFVTSEPVDIHDVGYEIWRNRFH